MSVCEIDVELFLSGVCFCAWLPEGDSLMIREFLFYLPLKEKVFFVACRSVCFVVGALWGEES